MPLAGLALNSCYAEKEREIFESLAWFVERLPQGSSTPDTVLEGRRGVCGISATSIHWSIIDFFASRISTTYRDVCINARTPIDPLSRYWKVVGDFAKWRNDRWSSCGTHQCPCPCTLASGRCSPFLIGLRCLFVDPGYRYIGFPPWRALRFLLDIHALYGLWTPGYDSPIGEKELRLIIGLICMNVLEIPHFCCFLWMEDEAPCLRRGVDDDDIEELADDHKYSITC